MPVVNTEVIVECEEEVKTRPQISIIKVEKA